MKKKLLYVLGVVAIAAVVSFNIYSAKSDVVLSDLALANVEALASGESGGENGTLYGNSDGTRFCCCPGTRTCGASKCSNCPDV